MKKKRKEEQAGAYSSFAVMEPAAVRSGSGRSTGRYLHAGTLDLLPAGFDCGDRIVGQRHIIEAQGSRIAILERPVKEFERG